MTHKPCDTAVFSADPMRPQMNRRVAGNVFAYVTRLRGGIGDTYCDMFVRGEECDECLAREELENGYRLCLAKLAFDRAIGH